VKTLTVRLPDSMVAEIDAESRARKVSKSDIVRERLHGGPRSGARRSALLDGIADLIGSVDCTPEDLSVRVKEHLKSSGYGRKRPR
jgi:Arc/MetJ-type ribon-helix-helix transcriptional regulator